MQSIVVPTDFSFISFNALELAKKIAAKIDGTIYLVHVIEPFIDKYAGLKEIGTFDQDESFTSKLKEKIANELKILKKAHASRFYEIKARVLIGDPFQKIKEFIQFMEPDLVIMGAKGHTDTKEFLLGSLSEKVVRSNPYPIITVKEKVDTNDLKNIVYATDLEDEHAQLVKLLKKIQSLFESKLHIVKINTRKNFSNDIDTMVEFRRLADKYQLEDYTLSCYSHEDEEYDVVYFADHQKADLIAMGVKEKSAIQRLISGGSLADEVKDHTFRPVLTFRYEPE